MTTIIDLKPNFLSISDEDRVLLIRELRALRRIPKPKKPAKPKKASTKKAPKKTTANLIASLTPAQAKALYEKLNKKG